MKTSEQLAGMFQETLHKMRLVPPSVEVFVGELLRDVGHFGLVSTSAFNEEIHISLSGRSTAVIDADGKMWLRPHNSNANANQGDAVLFTAPKDGKNHAFFWILLKDINEESTVVKPMPKVGVRDLRSKDGETKVLTSRLQTLKPNGNHGLAKAFEKKPPLVDAALAALVVNSGDTPPPPQQVTPKSPKRETKRAIRCSKAPRLSDLKV